MKKAKLLLALVLVISLLASVTFADNYENGSNGESVKKIQQQLKKAGYFTGEVTGYYGDQTEKAVKAFQKKKGLKADGVVGQATYKLLFNTTSKTAKVQATSSTTVAATTKDENASTESDSKAVMLDWWKSVTNIFKRGDVAKVTDIKTGRSFTVIRTYGRNHADVEARTTKDSSIIKDIWGGWSWERRPVIVEIDGKKIAASMTAMPHAGLDKLPANKVVSNRSGGFRRGTNLDTIKNNGMNGHMDIHFLNSRNHYNNKIDPKHQAVVKAAAAYMMKSTEK